MFRPSQLRQTLQQTTRPSMEAPLRGVQKEFLVADDKKKRGRGNPTPKKYGPPFDKRRDLPDPSKPKCGKTYIFRGIVRKCGKRGYHFTCGPGKG